MTKINDEIKLGVPSPRPCLASPRDNTTRKFEPQLAVYACTKCYIRLLSGIPLQPYSILLGVAVILSFIVCRWVGNVCEPAPFAIAPRQPKQLRRRGVTRVAPAAIERSNLFTYRRTYVLLLTTRRPEAMCDDDNIVKVIPVVPVLQSQSKAARRRLQSSTSEAGQAHQVAFTRYVRLQC